MTDTKLIVNLELREKFTQLKKTWQFHDNESENISGSEHRGCGAYSRAALINIFVSDAALIRGMRLIEGGAY